MSDGIQAPPLDFIPETGTNGSPFSPPPVPMVQAPVMPPPPISIPKISPEMRRHVAAGGPVHQQITHSIYSGAPGSGGFDPLGMPGTSKKGMPCAQFLASLAGSPDGLDFIVEVHRTGPAIWQKQRLPSGKVDQFTPMTYPEVYEQVRQLHGGGSYRIVIINPEGQKIHNMQFTINTLTDPPILNHQNPSVPPLGFSVFGGVGDGVSPQDDIVKLRTEEMRLRSQKNTVIAEADLEETKDQIKKRRQMAMDMEEKKLLAPVTEQQRVAQTMREEMRDQQDKSERRFEMMLQGFQNMIIAMTQNKGDDKNLPLMIEMMRSQTASQTALISAMMQSGGSKSSELAEAMKLQNESNKQIMQMSIQSAAAGAAKSDKMLEHFFVHKLEHPENAVKQAMDMRNAGFEQARQIFDMVESIRGERHDEGAINPEGSFMGNMGNLLLVGLKNLVAGAARGGGSGKLMEALATGLGKPAGTSQFTDAELAHAAQHMAASVQQQQRQLPAPQVPVMQQPQVQAQPRPRGRLFDGFYETEADVVPVQQQVPPAPAPVSVAVQMAPVFQTPVEQVPVMPLPAGLVAPVADVEMDIEGEETPEDRLAQFVTDAMEIAVTDITDGRQEHEWVDFALAKWNASFKAALAEAPDDAARVGLLQQYTEPSVWEKFRALLTNPERHQQYNIFVQNLKEFTEGVKAEAVPAGV